MTGTYTITVNVDNPTFDGGGAELARILRELADRFESYGGLEAQTRILRDINGDRVGQVEWKERGGG